MEVLDSMLEDRVHVINLYPVEYYGLDILKENAQTREFHSMGQWLDKHHLMAICSSGYYVSVAFDN